MALEGGGTQAGETRARTQEGRGSAQAKKRKGWWGACDLREEMFGRWEKVLRRWSRGQKGQGGCH